MSRGWRASERLHELARALPDAAAIVDGGEVLTWSDLDARCDDVAAGLTRAGVRAGQVVALAGGSSAATVASILGILRAGGVAAPLPAGMTAAERAAAMELLTPVLVLGVDGLAHPGRTLEAAGIVVLTSGTTGRPRGVVLSEPALAASADAWLAALPPATGWLLALGLGHVAGLGVVWRAMRAGVPTRIVPGDDPGAQLAGLLAAPAASHVSLVPGQLDRLLDAAGAAAGDVPPPPSLRAVLLGGGPIPAPLVLRAARAGWPVIPTYGLSEMGSGVTALPASEAAEAPGSAGRPLPGMSVAILDPGPDGIGEIVVRGPSRCSGYLDQPVLDPSRPLHTGDLGRLDDAGRLIVADRRMDRIVRGGENLSPAEVEGVLEAHPDVAEAAVVARQDARWGQVPVAAIVLAAGRRDPGNEALAAHARASLAGFKVPVTFARLDALPRTAGGKLRREPVRALLAGEPTGELARPGGDAIGWRLTGDGPLPLLLLPGTLSNAAQLDRLAAELARGGDLTVHAIDRRGTGTGRLAHPRPLDVAVHLDDLVAYLDARGICRAAVAGISFGGVLALELAARHPDRVAAVVAYEPPYGGVADGPTRGAFRTLAAATAEAHRRGGAPAAAETFLRAVAGDAAWDRLHERGRAFLAREGDGALADSGLTGLRPAGLAGIAAPVTILTGGASEPLYAPIAIALADRIPGARRDTLVGLAHPSPITEPARVAAAVRTALADAGLVAAPPDPQTATVPEPSA